MAEKTGKTSLFDGLLKGNSAYASKANKAKLKELLKGQHPYAAVLSCSDSRVPAEAVLGAKGPGEIFVIRVAGNVAADASVLGSIEYAVEHLHVPLLLVMGHSECGAIKGAMKGGEQGHIAALLSHLEPVCDKAHGDLPKAVELNVREQIRVILDSSDVVRLAREKGSLEVAGAVYFLDTGKIARVF
ncbi:MAG: carbonic anhydrase [Candidatus Burarchaeum sp.]|nr:carbonic anhydrase [Candidatus Burarchaeum sp.]MDO8339963.1 carbonic anhydrase [Candidatus Burarchaeum sp.]